MLVKPSPLHSSLQNPHLQPHYLLNKCFSAATQWQGLLPRMVEPCGWILALHRSAERQARSVREGLVGPLCTAALRARLARGATRKWSSSEQAGPASARHIISPSRCAGGASIQFNSIRFSAIGSCPFPALPQGYSVELLEAGSQPGGLVAGWKTASGRSVEVGIHVSSRPWPLRFLLF